MHLGIAAIGLLFLAGCASPPTTSDILRSQTSLLLLGEQHDAQEHHELQREVVAALAGRGVLAALVLEMAEAGTSTADLSPGATDAQVRAALRWDVDGWPWAPYAPAILAAVAAGVPVVGANLTREGLRAAMIDASLDTALAGPVLKAQQQAIRTGHCGLLPETQIGPMTRVQIARDQSMAKTLSRLPVPGKTVVLIAGRGHVDPAVGIPLYLPVHLSVATVLLPPSTAPAKDYCEDLRRSMRPKPAQ